MGNLYGTGTQRPPPGQGAAGDGAGMSTGTSRIPEREIHQVLSSERRRLTLERLRSAGGAVSVRELSEAVAAAEAGQDPPPRSLRESVYVSLHQTHLPKLHDLGVVEYDEGRKEVRLRDGVRRLSPYMEVATPIGLTWSEYYRSLGVASLFLIVAAEAELPGLSGLSPLVVATVALAVFAVSIAYQFWRRRWALVRAVRSWLGDGE